MCLEDSEKHPTVVCSRLVINSLYNLLKKIFFLTILGEKYGKFH
jgi:hypothetical protein